MSCTWLTVACYRSMSRSRVSLVALVAVIVLGLLHNYADHLAGIVPEFVSKVEPSDVNLNVKEKQAESSLVVQEILDHAQSDEQILKQLEELKLENAKLWMRSAQFMRDVADSLTQWKPLRDLTKISVRSFISEIKSREPGDQGPPELFEFPSALSHGRHLCFKGNDTHNGTRNFYTFAWEEALPSGHLLLNGTTLISETEYDYNNPWHSMCNLVQFVHWKLKNGCSSKAERLIIYHWSELRRTMGGWITQVHALPSPSSEFPLTQSMITAFDCLSWCRCSLLLAYLLSLRRWRMEIDPFVSRKRLCLV
jgi:hypothetical protein